MHLLLYAAHLDLNARALPPQPLDPVVRLRATVAYLLQFARWWVSM